ncbi:MAG: signal peptide peptidase SppA [Deltaproteobacteria bacterium]|nr:signal peptide peptidase SppA [Deltaproteobacteria bacterium]
MRSRYLTIIILLISLTACSGPQVRLFREAPEPLREFTLEGVGKDKILLIPVTGLISDMPKKGVLRTSPSLVEQVVLQLNKAEKDKQIKAVLLKINSPGGTITASDLLYHEIMSFKEKTGAKIIISMMDIAASGAYYMSLPADKIMAHPTSVTGSVGVIFLQPRVTGLMDKLGLGVDVKKFGKNKDMGSPFRESSEEEQKLLQKAVNDFGERFIRLVQKHRNLDQRALTDVATGRIFLADDALKLGLVDNIGYLSDAVKESKKLANVSDDARVIVYRRAEFPEDNYYNVAGVASEDVSVSVISMDLLEPFSLKTGFYYLWPGFLAHEK